MVYHNNFTHCSYVVSNIIKNGDDFEHMTEGDVQIDNAVFCLRDLNTVNFGI